MTEHGKPSDINEGVAVENGDESSSRFKEVLDNPEKLLKYLSENEDTETVIRPIAWELTGSIMTFMRENAVSDNLPIYENCLKKIAEFSSPKELYLGILEQFDPSVESKYIELLLPALSVVLDRVCTENIDVCVTVLETTFSTLSYYLESLNVPDYEDFDPSVKQQKIFESQKIERFIDKYLTMMRPVIDKICCNREKISADFSRFEDYTFQFLCSLLVMLGQLDLDEYQENPISTSGSPTLKFDKKWQQSGEHDAPKVSKICHDIMFMISRFHSPNVLWHTVNWFELHPAEERSREGKLEVEKQVDRGRACYLFLLLCRKILYDQFPKIYSSQCLLVQSALSLNTLLSCQNQCVVWKGLEILGYIFDHTKESSICYKESIYNITRSYGTTQAGVQSRNAIYDIFQNVINVAVMLPSKTVRTTAIQYVCKLLDLFLWQDKYAILIHLLKTTEHTGVCGVLIGFLKDKLDQILQNLPPENSSVFCEAHKMSALGEMVFILPQGPETDLLQDCDRLMPALNLLRFILIRDKANRTGVLDNLDRIDKMFLKPLRSAIDLSRAHYENELRKYKKGPKHVQNNETEFVVNGTPLPTLPYNEQRRTLEAALHSFDMIEIVTIRVIELIEASHSKSKVE